MNPDEEIIYPKNQYKKYIKDVVSGTLERRELIEETIIKHFGPPKNETIMKHFGPPQKMKQLWNILFLGVGGPAGPQKNITLI